MSTAIVMKKTRQKLTLDQPATYQIKVPGHLNESLVKWHGKLMIVVESDHDGFSVSTLTGTFDQAALQSFLRLLYSLGLPLISAICVDCGG
jgi:hypothetical protein